MTLIGLIGAIIGMIVGVIASIQITRPISQLVEGVRRLGERELGYQVKLRNPSREIEELADAINTMSANLEHAEELRRNLMADVSHELRTPLTVLEGNLRAALDDVFSLNEAEIANLYSQTHHLIRLVEDLHLLATAEAHQLPLNTGSVDVGDVLREVIDNFAPLAEENSIDLILNTEANSSPLTLDAGRLRQVLTNLVDNALRHTPTEGRVTVGLQQQAAMVALTIEDTGEGVAPDHLPHLFDRFYRADASRARTTGGSGLGLAIVKALVELQGGEITVASDGPGKGTCFRIEFPVNGSR